MTTVRSTSWCRLVVTVALIAAATISTATVTASAVTAKPVAAATDPATTILTAQNVGSVKNVGPLFFPGRSLHSCNATVVDSPQHDLLLTAAHCLSGTGAGIMFAPGYYKGAVPYGLWTVQRVWVSGLWLNYQDERFDFAFLQIAPRKYRGVMHNIQYVTGASALRIAQPARTTTSILGYPTGTGDAPIDCINRLYYTSGFPSFDCHGYVSGTSGSPFLATPATGETEVFGVIGGLHQGGCYESTSYSSTFGTTVKAIFARAMSGRGDEVIPPAGGDGC
jgi:V8-like Glu-specific endopeptidase